jgi:Zn-dependent peptidase ImmA (M78 family)
MAAKTSRPALPPWADAQRQQLTPPAVLEAIGMMRAPVPVLDVAERLGLHVRGVSGWPSSVSGEIQYDGVHWPVIRYNADHAPNRGRFTIAHEIGHAVLHLRAGVPSEFLREDSLKGTPEEAQANAFAASLLMPFPLLHEEIRTNGRVHGWLAEIFGVSKAAMAIQLGRYDQWLAGRLRY